MTHPSNSPGGFGAGDPALPAELAARPAAASAAAAVGGRLGPLLEAEAWARTRRLLCAGAPSALASPPSSNGVSSTRRPASTQAWTHASLTTQAPAASPMRYFGVRRLAHRRGPVAATAATEASVPAVEADSARAALRTREAARPAPGGGGQRPASPTTMCVGMQRAPDSVPEKRFAIWATRTPPTSPLLARRLMREAEWSLSCVVAMRISRWVRRAAGRIVPAAAAADSRRVPDSPEAESCGEAGSVSGSKRAPMALAAAAAPAAAAGAWASSSCAAASSSGGDSARGRLARGAPPGDCERSVLNPGPASEEAVRPRRPLRLACPSWPRRLLAAAAGVRARPRAAPRPPVALSQLPWSPPSICPSSSSSSSSPSSSSSSPSSSSSLSSPSPGASRRAACTGAGEPLAADSLLGRLERPGDMDTSDADTDRLSLGAAPRSAVAPPGRSSPASAPAAAFSASLEHDPSAAASTRKSSRYSLVSSDRASSVMVSSFRFGLISLRVMGLRHSGQVAVTCMAWSRHCLQNVWPF
mmetsp:Transcript_670/g.2680  ORF Transcript_670/g.2680 Transcript_670/m.2680 type:complete len:530 (+) Transcript_670:830-2419(+)